MNKSQEEINKLGKAFNDAVLSRNKVLIKKMIDDGIDLNAEWIGHGDYKYIIGHSIMYSNDFADIFEYMLDHGFDINNKCSNGIDGWCVIIDCPKLYKVLFKRGQGEKQSYSLDKTAAMEKANIFAIVNNTYNIFDENENNYYYKKWYNSYMKSFYRYEKKCNNWNKRLVLKKRLNELENEIIQLKNEIIHLKYLPGGPGYEEAKEHFYLLAK